MVTRFALGPALGLVILLSGCRETTQLTLLITTDERCEDLRGGTAITVTTLDDLETAHPQTETAACSDGGVIGSLVIVPSRGDDDHIAIRVATGVDRNVDGCSVPSDGGTADIAGCIVARRALRFVPHASITLPVVMRTACKGVDCAFDRTCVAGKCVPARCEARACDEGTLGRTLEGVSDAGSEAEAGDAVAEACLPFDGGACRHIEQVVAGTNHTCALLSDGTVRCWGSNFAAQLGQPDRVLRVTPVEVPGLTDVVQLAAGGTFTCGRKKDDTLVCWGNISNFDGTASPGAIRPVAGLSDAKSLSARGNHICALRSDQTVWCWGSNSAGECGQPGPDCSLASAARPSADVPVPTQVAGLRATHVTLGDAFSCAIGAGDGGVSCWGENSSGQLGGGANGAVQCATAPGLIPALPLPAVGLGAGGYAACSIGASGSLTCWGSPPGATVQPTPELEGVAQVALGSTHACALKTGGGLWCWGSKGAGQTGFLYGEAPDMNVPTEVRSLRGRQGVALAAGATFTCLLLADRVTLLCFGDNEQGQLGDGTIQSRAIALPVAW